MASGPASTRFVAQERNTPRPAAAASGSGISEILKLLDAGVSQEVIKTYIENSPVAYQPSAADLIALKGRGVSDDITIALVKRGADLKAQASQAEAASKSAMVAAFLNRTRNNDHLDPESYEYFQHYYLLPRTLAWANEQLGYYPSPYWR